MSAPFRYVTSANHNTIVDNMTVSSQKDERLAVLLAQSLEHGNKQPEVAGLKSKPNLYFRTESIKRESATVRLFWTCDFFIFRYNFVSRAQGAV